MNNIYLALDFPMWKEAGQFLDKNDLHGVPVKVGMELFYREGISVVEKLKERNHPIFLDLKLYDIPTTVMRTMKNLAQLDVDFVNVHALGGSDMIKRAKEGLLAGSSSTHETKLLAVTILTSMDELTVNNDLRIAGTINETVLHLAKLSENSGADGVVCSVHEAQAIKQTCSAEFMTMTPGIRLADSAEDDQKRVATPAFARENGSTSLVIGRSITQADDPLQAYERALKEWKHGTTV